MGAAGAVVVLILLVLVAVGYSAWLKQGIKTRVLESRLSATQLREIFSEKVARTGWSIVDTGNPMVAQSSLIAGTRQQIGLFTEPTTGGTQVRVVALRFQRKALSGTPTKGHTLRIRMNSFVDGVRQQDPSAQLSTPSR
jgi:hypothetical protein